MELSDFVKKVSSRGRVTFGDIKRLQRDLLPNGAMTRDQVEALIAMDGAVRRADPAWAAYLTHFSASYPVGRHSPGGKGPASPASSWSSPICPVTRREQ